MCIAIVTSGHKDYPLILLSNRDEYLQRPTAPAEWWDPPHSHVLGGRDMHRAERGTWLGITKQGRITCLTNFREEGQLIIEGRRSRGAVVNSFLKTDPTSSQTPQDAAGKLIEEGLDGIGGFSLLFGRLGNMPGGSKERGLAIVSNRSLHPDDITWILQNPGETHALSNSHFEDKSWAKVVDGEKLVSKAVKEAQSKQESKEDMIHRFLDILSTDTLPRRKTGEDYEVYLYQLRNSIFIPAIGNDLLEDRKESDQVAAANGTPNGTAAVNPTGGVYGTQKQSVIFVSKDGKVTFFERTLYDQLGKPITKGEGDRQFEFDIEGW